MPLLIIDTAALGRDSDRLALLDALEFDTLVQAIYTDEDGVRSLRYFIPQAIKRNKDTGEPYVKVYDVQRRAHRTFVLSRIEGVSSDF